MATKKGTSSPVSRGLKARELVTREQQLIECVVGNAVRKLMDPAIKEAPDLAAIYKRMGGKTEFTIRLLAETFGSASLKKKGAYPLKARTAPNLAAMTKALEAKALELVDKGVYGISKRPVINGSDADDAVWVFEASPRMKASCSIEID